MSIVLDTSSAMMAAFAGAAYSTASIYAVSIHMLPQCANVFTPRQSALLHIRYAMGTSFQMSARRRAYSDSPPQALAHLFHIRRRLSPPQHARHTASELAAGRYGI